jgi:opacity protein-like surface antigen
VTSLRALVPSLLTAALSTLHAGIARAEPSELVPEVGYNYNEIETPRISATGGAVRALSSSVHSLFVNPANLTAARVYHLGAFAQIVPEARRQSYGAAAVDSLVSSARVAGGVGATYNFQDVDGIDRRWTDLRAALAYPVADQFFMGVGGRYLWLSENGNGPLGASLASNGLPDARIVKGFALDAGATLKAGKHLSLSLVGNNLNNPDHGFQPTSVGGGIGVVVSDYSAEADIVADFTTWDRTTVRPMLGLEGLFADHFAARLGYRYDQGAESHALAIGAGYIDRAFDIDVGVRRVVSGDTATSVTFGFSYHLESTGLTPAPSDTF